MKVLLVDNYDSFTYNLYQLLCRLGAKVIVRRNDAVDVESAKKLRPSHIVLSPGPGGPEESGACLDLIRELGSSVPLLGVCLGHQALAHALGGVVRRAPRLMHGKTSPIRHDGKGLYKGVPSPVLVARYHSLAVTKVPAGLSVTARSADGVVMGVRHRRWPAQGVQFHPESFATEHGETMLRNFLKGAP